MENEIEFRQHGVVYEQEIFGLTPAQMRDKIVEIECVMNQHPEAKFGDDAAPLKHTFGDGCYVRQITMAKGMLITSKIHKFDHPYFVLTGECSVVTDDKIVRIKAPYWGMTKAGTKRILYIHEETVWVTVHVTDSTDLKEIEGQIIAPSFEEFFKSAKKEACLCQ